jgi:hypothetical protein
MRRNAAPIRCLATAQESQMLLLPLAFLVPLMIADHCGNYVTHLAATYA